MATPPDFTAGQVLLANAHMNKIGLWLIKTQTIGTAVSTVTVTDAFSADYDNYRIIVSGGAGSADMGLALTLGSAATGYYYAAPGHTFANATVANSGVNATAFALAGMGSATGLSMNVDVFRPFATDETMVTGFSVFATTLGRAQWYGGYLNNTTSYTAFTITTSTGTVTGGTIYVYGWRD
jgi:hypothetical protein